MTDQKHHINHNYSAFSSIVETISILKQNLLFRISMQHICFSVWYHSWNVSLTNVIKKQWHHVVRFSFFFAARLLFMLQTNKINVAESNTLGQFNMEIRDTSHNTWRRGNQAKIQGVFNELNRGRSNIYNCKNGVFNELNELNKEFLMSLMSLTTSL